MRATIAVPGFAALLGVLAIVHALREGDRTVGVRVLLGGANVVDPEGTERRALDVSRVFAIDLTGVRCSIVTDAGETVVDARAWRRAALGALGHRTPDGGS